MSENREKFVALAEKRVNNAIRQIRGVGKLGNLNRYEYTEEDAKKICTILREEVERVRENFLEKNKKIDSFSLD